MAYYAMAYRMDRGGKVVEGGGQTEPGWAQVEAGLLG